MKNRNRLMVICSIALVMMVAIGATLAYFTSIGSAENKFSTADPDSPTHGVDVTITEPGWTDDNGSDMMPGDIARKDPTIVNKKGTAYGRVVIVLYDTKDPANPVEMTDAARAQKIMDLIFYDESKFDASGKPNTKMTTAELQALPRINDKFVHAARASRPAGQFFYNIKDNNTIKQGERLQLFSGVCIPSDFTEADIKELGNFTMKVFGQAIQTKNLTWDEAEVELDAQLDAELKK